MLAATGCSIGFKGMSEKGSYRHATVSKGVRQSLIGWSTNASSVLSMACAAAFLPASFLRKEAVLDYDLLAYDVYAGFDVGRSAHHVVAIRAADQQCVMSRRVLQDECVSSRVSFQKDHRHFATLRGKFFHFQRLARRLGPKQWPGLLPCPS